MAAAIQSTFDCPARTRPVSIRACANESNANHIEWAWPPATVKLGRIGIQGCAAQISSTNAAKHASDRQKQAMQHNYIRNIKLHTLLAIARERHDLGSSGTLQVDVEHTADFRCRKPLVQ